MSTSDALWQLFLVLVLILPVLALELPPLVPAVHDHITDGSASIAFRLPQHLRIVVDERDAQSTADDGLTLIPPTLLEFAQTFQSDLETLFPKTTVSLSRGNVQNTPNGQATITLSLSDRLNATHADGTSTSEGYEMEVSPTGVQIVGAGSKGAFWATRTLLQGLVLTGGQFPAGKVVDQPDWRTRGFMLGTPRCSCTQVS